jgi:type IV secretory pathway VirB4 component
MQLVLWAPSRAELDRRVAAVTGKLMSKGFGWFEEARAHDLEIFKSLPGLSLRFDRHLVVTSNNAVDLLPVFSPEHGDRNPALMMHTATGNHLFGYNPYERNRDNWNASVFGASGSGKTVVMNMLMTSAMLGQNYGCGRVLVVDHAGPNKSSYKMLSDLFGGVYQTVVSDQKCALNPFPPASVARSEDGTLKGDVLARLLVMTDLLIENTADGQDSARNRIIIQRALCDTYSVAEGGRCPDYRDVLTVLQGYLQSGTHGSDPGRLRALVELMQGFVSSPFAKLFLQDGAPPRDADKAFVVFDLFGIDALPPPIQNALVYLVSSRVRDLAFDPKDARMKTIILDEVAQLIRQPSMLGLFEELYCTARGHNTSVWTVTQLYLDFCKSAIAGTSQVNSTSSIFMSHAENAESVRQRIIEDWHFNGREAALFRSLRSVKGEFSELLLRTEVFDAKLGKRPVTAKLKLLLSPLDYEIVTSDRLDRQRQQEFIARHPELPLVDALEKLAMAKRRDVLRKRGQAIEKLEDVA